MKGDRGIIFQISPAVEEEVKKSGIRGIIYALCYLYSIYVMLRSERSKIIMQYKSNVK